MLRRWGPRRPLCRSLPARARPHAFTVDGLAKLAKVFDAHVTAAERFGFFAVSSSRTDLNRCQHALYMQAQAQPQLGPPAQQITSPERGLKQKGQDISPRPSAKGQRLAFLSTRDGAAPPRYIMPIGGGKARRLTTLPGGVGGAQRIGLRNFFAQSVCAL